MDFEHEFLDPYEELEMRYADDIEILREMEEDNSNINSNCKKSLNFDDISIKTNLPSTYVAQKITQNKKNNNLSPEVSQLPQSKKSTNYNENNKISYSQEPSCSYSSNKRTFDELFGDIDDIDFNDEQNLQVKRIRSEEADTQKIIDKDALTISKILEKRKSAQCVKNKENFRLEDNLNDQNFEITLTRRVPQWAFVTLRNGKNEKFYARFHSDYALNNEILAISEQCKTLKLISSSFEDVMAEANAIMDKKYSNEKKNSEDINIETYISKPDVTELWVEKYKPVTYLDLLSDEGTNRTLLKWIKCWDKVVFGKEIKFRKKDRENAKFKSFKQNFPELDEELDEFECPKYKLALLCGPPGLGKTTLAHLIAKQAGYNIVEMNASDDRSPSIFKERLEAATQMKAVIGKNPKPNCLVIDEIDGAPSASIDVLIKFAKSELKSKTKKKTSKISILKRPVICICNDVYVPALRALRQMAFVINFPPTPISRLAQRLVEIARAENVKTDTGAMLALCEKVNNDIRTCLSTIYCLKDQPIRIATIQNTNVGNKDMRKGLFTVWQEIFQIKNEKVNSTYTKSKVNNKSELELFLSKRMHTIIKSVQGNGDYDRLTQGVYENFLNVNKYDGSMENISKGLSWFCFMDEIKTTILNTQTYTLMGYMPYCFVVWSFLFSCYQRTKLNYPSIMYEIYSRQTKCFQIIQEVLKNMNPKIRTYCCGQQLLLDTFSYFTNILNPALRPVSIQLFSSSEKNALRQLVNIMIDYSLNFIQERTQNGSYEFSMDPNIEDVVEFPDIPKNKILTYSLKMMISREIEVEKVRRLENTILKSVGGTLSAQQNKSIQNEGIIANASINESEQSVTRNHLQKLTPKIIKTSICSVTKDFFGRITEKSVQKSDIAKIDDILKSDIWFHFKEGFSNAVRRTVYMKDLYRETTS